MQQKRSVNFDEWKQAYRDGFDGFILSCGETTSEDYIIRFSELSEVEKVVYRSDGVHVTFKREKVKEVEEVDQFKKYLPYGVAFFLGYFLAFTITFFVMA